MKLNRIDNEHGFTLIELLVAIAVGSLIILGVTLAIYQMFNVNASTTNRLYAIRQLQNVGIWVSSDAQSTQTISFDDEDTTGVIEFLVFSRVDWDGANYKTTYVINSNGDMYRYEYQDDVETGSTLIADSIRSDESSCELDTENGLLTLTITADVGGFGRAIETRVYEVVPRYVL
jgi:prepilin-type N-terminal cleavage/methylation domain-containing protein